MRTLIFEDHAIDGQRERIAALEIVRVLTLDQAPFGDDRACADPFGCTGEIGGAQWREVPSRIYPGDFAVPPGHQPVEAAFKRRCRHAQRLRDCGLCTDFVERRTQGTPFDRLAGNPALLAAAPLAFQKAPGVHRDQPADDPGQRDDPECQTDHVVPVEPAAIRRELTLRLQPELADADDESDRCEECAESEVQMTISLHSTTSLRSSAK